MIRLRPNLKGAQKNETSDLSSVTVLITVAGILALVLRCTLKLANNTAVVGTVLDSCGSAVVGAKVTAVEESTGVSIRAPPMSRATTRSSSFLPALTTSRSTRPGFTKLTKTGTIVPMDQAIRTDFSLKVGSETQTVSVRHPRRRFPTTTLRWAKPSTPKPCRICRLMGHNALEIAATASNVTIGPSSGYNNVPPGEDFIGAGQREIQSSMTLDGVSIMNNLITTAPARPSSDMISEVQMQSGNYPAQYGSYLGLHVNLVSKSGKQ